MGRRRPTTDQLIRLGCRRFGGSRLRGSKLEIPSFRGWENENQGSGFSLRPGVEGAKRLGLRRDRLA